MGRGGEKGWPEIPRGASEGIEELNAPILGEGDGAQVTVEGVGMTWEKGFEKGRRGAEGTAGIV